MSRIALDSNILVYNHSLDYEDKMFCSACHFIHDKTGSEFGRQI